MAAPFMRRQAGSLAWQFVEIREELSKRLCRFSRSSQILGGDIFGDESEQPQIAAARCDQRNAQRAIV